MENKTKILSIAIIAVAITAVAATQGEVNVPFFTDKGELFLLNAGETETIKIPGGRITVQLLEIGHDPLSVSDVQIDDIVFSDDNPDPGESVHISIPITNTGTGTAHTVGVSIQYGDEHQGGGQGSEGIIEELHPGETVVLESDHVYEEEGIYTVMVVAKVSNDIDNTDNIRCEEIRVGNPQGGGGGCGGLGPNEIPEQAHILYTKYHGQSVVEQQELWLKPQDIGFSVEVIKLSPLKALLAVPK